MSVKRLNNIRKNKDCSKLELTKLKGPFDEKRNSKVISEYIRKVGELPTMATLAD